MITCMNGLNNLKRNKMKEIIKIISNFFKAKCPDCNSPMDNISEHFGSQVYKCNKCKTEWI